MNEASGPLLVVTGLFAEARIAAGPGVITLAGGGATDFDARLEAEIVRLRPRGLLSFGVAGGLDPALKVGDAVVATHACGPGWDMEADLAWATALAAATGARLARVAASPAPAADVAHKRRLREATGGAVVDMETHAVAHLARERRLPFAVLRVVSDTAGEALPAAALAGMRADGRTDALAVAGALLRRPGELPSLIRTARGYGTAMRRLQEVRAAAGPRFALT